MLKKEHLISALIQTTHPAHFAHLVTVWKSVHMSSLKQCQYCGKVFSRSFNLRRHLENGSCKMNQNFEYYNSRTDEHAPSSAERFAEETEVGDDEYDESFESDSGEESDDSELSWCWQVLVDEAVGRHESKRQEIVDNLLSTGETEAEAVQIANEKIVPVVRKELRNVLVEKLEWMHEMRRDPYFQKIMNTRKDLLENGDYGWLEAIKLAVHNRKYLLNDLLSQYLQKTYNEAESNSEDDME